MTPVNFAFLPGNVLRYGAVGDGSTNNTTAFAHAMAQALRLGGSAIYVPAGNYVVAITLTGGDIRIYGEDPHVTYLTAVSSTADVITCGAGAQQLGVTIQDLTIQGNGAATAGNGIHIPAVVAFAWGFRFQNLVLINLGNSGIYDEAGVFSTLVENVRVDNCGGHGFDFHGAVPLTFVNCYALRVPVGTGKAGFRVHNGGPVFSGCNGANAGDYRGIFGDTPAEDGTVAYCWPTLIGCNIEAFSVAGIYCKQFGMTSMRCSYLSTIASTVAIRIRPGNLNCRGELDCDTSFQVTGSGSWLNGYPVHTVRSSGDPLIPPFTVVRSPAGNTQFSWYDETSASVVPMSTLMVGYISPARFGVMVQDLRVYGLIRTGYANTATLSGGTATVTFGAPTPDTSYVIVLSGNANETFHWSGKSTSGFTITLSNSGSAAAVDWKVELAGAGP